MKFTSDVDIDFADRNEILSIIPHVPAAMRNVDPIRRHNSGVHITDIPVDSLNNMAGIDYTEAEKRGYIKLDFLNVWIYNHVRDDEHLTRLMAEPDWTKLHDRQFFERLIHVGRHYDTSTKMSEPITNIARMSMFLSVIRPGKKHLIGKTWEEISETIWKPESDGYTFKKSHAVAYAHLVVIHMNLLEENPNLSSSSLTFV